MKMKSRSAIDGIVDDILADTEKGGHLETNLAADLNVERKVITDLMQKRMKMKSRSTRSMELLMTSLLTLKRVVI